MELEKEKKYNIIINDIKYVFKIVKGYSGWFVHFANHFNDVLFSCYNINKKELITKTLGYYNNKGDWPYCETQNDCEKLLFVLIEEISKKEECICDFCLLNKNNCWYD